MSDRYPEVAQSLRVDVAAAVRRTQRRYIMRLAASYTAVVILTAGLAIAGVLARMYVQSLPDPWRLLLILLLWLTIAVAIYLVASLSRSAIVSLPSGLELGRVGQIVWRSVVRFAMAEAPMWVIALAVAAVLIAAGALAYENWPVAAEWRVSSDPLVSLSLGAAVLVVGALARITSRRWRASQDQRRQRRLSELPDDLRAEPHTRPVEVTLEPEPDSTRTFTVRLEPHPDPGTQTLQEVTRSWQPEPPGGDLMTIPQPFTVSAFLFGQDRDTEQALAQVLHQQGVLGSMGTTLELVSEAGREAATDQVAVVAEGLLDLDLGDLVVAGWRKQGQLAAAAERTAANPGISEVVEVATHRVSSAHHPYVELLVNDVHVATVTFDLDVELVIKALVVTVRDGHVISLHSGTCDIAATLAAEGVQLASRRAHFELPLVVRWPLLLHLGGGSDPLPYGAKPPQGSSPSPAPSPPRRRRSLIGPALRRQRRDESDEPGPPAD